MSQTDAGIIFMGLIDHANEPSQTVMRTEEDMAFELRPEGQVRVNSILMERSSASRRKHMCKDSEDRRNIMHSKELKEGMSVSTCPFDIMAFFHRTGKCLVLLLSNLCQVQTYESKHQSVGGSCHFSF